MMSSSEYVEKGVSTTPSFIRLATR